MAIVDIEVRDSIWKYLILIIPTAVIFYIFLERRFKSVRDRFFATTLHEKYQLYMEKLEPIKEELFEDLNYLDSNVVDLRNRGLIRILEIGVGTGTNLKYYPQQSRLIVVDPNIYFKQYFFENFKKFPDIFLEKFIVSWSGDEMLGIKSATVDVVVATTVLCSVPHVRKYLNEIRRVLTKGGRFYFLEHVPDTNTRSQLHKVQRFLTWSRIWPTLFDCHLDRHLYNDISRCGFSKIESKNIQIDHEESKLLKLIQNHIVGVAIK